jgi:GNAT superfamily N-acetyltransferase
MDVREVDPHDGSAFAEWFAVVDANQQHLWPGDPGWQELELRAHALEEEPERTMCFAAVDGSGAVVGSGRIQLPLRDNTHLVVADVWTHPQHVRRGAGTALLAEMERSAVADGRKVAMVTQDEPADLADASPGRAFALARGYTVAQRGYRRDLAVPGDPERLARLEEACAPYAGGYRMVTWADRCPDEYAEGRADLGRRMSTDAPLGELALEEEDWDVARVRQREVSTRAQGRTAVTAAAVCEATGELVAFTEIQIPVGVPQKAYQWDTLVLREHRGHRLGALVKLANLRQLAQVSPATTKIMTSNAAENAPMIAINEALGCEVICTELAWQKHL